MECPLAMKRAEHAFLAGLPSVRSMSMSTPQYRGLMGKKCLTIPSRRLLLEVLIWGEYPSRDLHPSSEV